MVVLKCLTLCYFLIKLALRFGFGKVKRREGLLGLVSAELHAYIKPFGPGTPFITVYMYIIYWTRLQHRRRSQQAEILLDQSVMWLRKATDWWCESGVECMSNGYTNPKTLTMLALTLTDLHDAFESFCVPEFCDFVRNYSCTVDGAVVTS